MSSYVQVMTTVDTKEAAEAMARQLVREKLAACVQVSGPVESTYRWKGQIETAQEWQCAIKTLPHRYGAVEEAIRELHSYDEPEIVAVPIVGGSGGYLKWIGDSVAD